MKLSCTLLTALALLAPVLRLTAGEAPKSAQPAKGQVNFVGFALDPFGPDGNDEDSAPTDRLKDLALRAEGGEAWQNELVSEGLKTWQILCKKGRLVEAEQLASMLVSLQPDNPKVRAACTVTQFFKSLGAQMAPEANCPQAAWQCPMPATLNMTGQCRNPELLPAPTCVAGCTSGVRQCCSENSACTNACTAERQSCCGKSCCSSQTASAKGCKCCKECTSCSCCEKQTPNQAVMCPQCQTPQCVALEFGFPHPPVQLALPMHPGMMPPPHVVVLPPGVEHTFVAQHIAPPIHVMAATMPRMPQARLVTPHLRAQCQRMTCAGSSDNLVLEGDVRLTYQKGSQQVQIEAQRVCVNVKDETFRVENQVTGDPTMDLRRSVHIMPVPPSQED
jgi:hypothetical protein